MGANRSKNASGGHVSLAPQPLNRCEVGPWLQLGSSKHEDSQELSCLFSTDASQRTARNCSQCRRVMTLARGAIGTDWPVYFILAGLRFVPEWLAQVGPF